MTSIRIVIFLVRIYFLTTVFCCCTALTKDFNAIIASIFYTTTTKTLETKVGVGDECKCVPYNRCLLQIDLRFNNCPNKEDICCNKRDIIPEPYYPTTVTENQKNPIGCGTPNLNLDFEVVENKDHVANFGELPWTVAFLNTASGAYYCSGSLIHPQVVLTAAHRLMNFHPDQFKVRAGDWDLRRTIERLPFQERNAQQIIMHPNYNPKNAANDFALVVVSQPFVLADHINVVCLPTPNLVPATGETCWASAWGRDKFGSTEQHRTIMKRVPLPVADFDACQSIMRKTRLGKFFQLDKSFMCAGGQEGVDTCIGDGGGPLVCLADHPQNRYYQSGIVSWSIGCNDRIPAVYASVALARNWIDKQMNWLGFGIASYSFDNNIDINSTPFQVETDVGDKCKCVPYDHCLRHDEQFDGSGQIDLRLDVNHCPNKGEICCNNRRILLEPINTTTVESPQNNATTTALPIQMVIGVKCKCVPYDHCSRHDEQFDGSGQIDLRLDVNHCPNKGEICCNNRRILLEPINTTTVESLQNNATTTALPIQMVIGVKCKCVPYDHCLRHDEQFDGSGQIDLRLDVNHCPNKGEICCNNRRILLEPINTTTVESPQNNATTTALPIQMVIGVKCKCVPYDHCLRHDEQFDGSGQIDLRLDVNHCPNKGEICCNNRRILLEPINTTTVESPQNNATTTALPIQMVIGVKCKCVPYDKCLRHDELFDGSGQIDFRLDFNHCPNNEEICCYDSSIVPEPINSTPDESPQNNTAPTPIPVETDVGEKCRCVPYDNCLRYDELFDGSGQIDIRLDFYYCPNKGEICCNDSSIVPEPINSTPDESPQNNTAPTPIPVETDVGEKCRCVPYNHCLRHDEQFDGSGQIDIRLDVNHCPNKGEICCNDSSIVPEQINSTPDESPQNNTAPTPIPVETDVGEKCRCVPYNHCLRHDEQFDGSGQIDIRLDVNHCPNKGEICCNDSSIVPEPINSTPDESPQNNTAPTPISVETDVGEKCRCVPYNHCLRHDEQFDGSGQIDIRLDVNHCPNKGEICCNDSSIVPEPINSTPDESPQNNTAPTPIPVETDVGEKCRCVPYNHCLQYIDIRLSSDINDCRNKEETCCYDRNIVSEPINPTPAESPQKNTTTTALSVQIFVGDKCKCAPSLGYTLRLNRLRPGVSRHKLVRLHLTKGKHNEATKYKFTSNCKIMPCNLKYVRKVHLQTDLAHLNIKHGNTPLSKCLCDPHTKKIFFRKRTVRTTI